MSDLEAFPFDPTLDLIFERVVPVRAELLWAGWTQPDLLTQWFAPAPFVATVCEIDLRPGGRFHTVLRSPEGEEFDNIGCYLEIVPNERLVWTNVMGAGFRPVNPPSPMPITATITLQPMGDSTRYTAIIRHDAEQTRADHDERGFAYGWGLALDQLVDVCSR